MPKMLTALILFLAFLLPHAEGSDKYILVRKIQGVEQLPSSLSKPLEKITLKVVTKQPGFRLLLAAGDGPSNSVDIVAVEPEVAREKDRYRIEARLVNIRTRRLMNKANLEGIRETDLLRLYESALETLFIPYRKKPVENEPREKPETALNNRPPRPQNTFNKIPDQHTLDFKKRVRDLKFGVDKQIAEIKEEAETKDSESEQKKKTNPASSNIASTPANISEEFFEQENQTSSPKYPMVYRFSAGLETRSVYSEYLVATTAKATVLNLDITGHKPLWFNGTTGIGYDLAYARGLSVPEETPALYRFGLYGTFAKPLWNVSLGLMQESSFFVNLVNPGEGLQTQSLTPTWFRLKGEGIVDYNGPWLLAASIGMPMMVETNYERLKDATSWQGTNFQFSITLPYQYKKFEGNISFEQTNLTTQGERPFTLNESRIAFSVRRSL